MAVTESQEPEVELSLIGHLTELRTRLFICILALAVSVLLGLVVARPVLHILTLPVQTLKQEPDRPNVLTLVVGADGALRIHDMQNVRITLDKLAKKRFDILFPADPAHKQPEARFEMGERAEQKFYYDSPLAPIMMLLKVALIVGILIALPIFLWQTWLFISPGLTGKERMVIKPILIGAVFLFPLGASFAYYMVQFVLLMMQQYAVENVAPLLDIFRYLSLVSNMMLVFGFIFEVPLILAIASRIGLVTPKFLKTYRRHAYVALAVAAMIITPGGDPFTMLIALIPLVVLYELSVALSKPMARLHQRDVLAKGGSLDPEEEAEEEKEETPV